MDPPPLTPLPTPTPITTTTTTPPTTATATAAAAATAASIQLNYPDSVDSSPRSRNADTWADEPLPPVPGAKLRLMCSYGGHIIPRPHDKSLCYVGGDTRIVVVDRHSSLSDLCTRLSRTLLNGRSFTLKYQLPNEELDSLISVTTDEDLENMIEEYDRTAASSPLKPSRVRLFLFFVKPETAASMGALLDDAKSETWFVDALNGSGLLPRGLSDSAVEDCLLSLDGVRASDSCNDLEPQGNSLGETNKQVVGMGKSNNGAQYTVQYSYSMSDSPFVENNSSFGSSSSSPSMSNLPPIRVRVEEQKMVGIDEQFAQISFAPPPSAINPVVSVGQVNNPALVSGENVCSKVLSDDERSDHGGGGGGGGAPVVGLRKPPLPLQPVQQRGGGGGGYSLPSPDSVASDTSIASASSLSKPIYYQDQLHPPPRETRAPASPDTRNNDNSDPGPTTQLQQQAKDSSYLLPPHLDQHHQQQQQQHQQYVQATSHYVHHPAASPVQMAPYYQVYHQTHQQFHHPIDQQYPVYVMSVAPQTAQPYNMPLQSNIADTTTAVASSRPLTSPSNASGIPPVYPAKAASPGLPDMAASGVYKTTMASNAAPLVQIPPTQFQQNYVGFSQMHHHPSQSIAVPSSAAGNYAFEYANPAPTAAHEQVFYTQHPPAAPLPSQYQSMTPAAAIALSEAAKQLPADNSNAQQQNRTSQPL